MAARLRVLSVDDSALMRRMLGALLAADPEIEFVGAAANPVVAREMIRDLNPDVITLDVEMPYMDGVSFLRKIMALRPTPVVMVSTLTTAGADVAVEALEIGAVDVIAKPYSAGAVAMDAFGAELRQKVKAAGQARPGRERAPRRNPQRNAARRLSERAVVAIGASTGGVEALKTVLMELSADCPPILIAQHMPAGFTAAFARRLDRECAMRVCEAADGTAIEPGLVCIAPGGLHMELARRRDKLVCALRPDEGALFFRPSVDVLFNSMARVARADGIGVILTGMGRDGAEGLLAMRRAGAMTVGQDYGMPRAAFERGAVAEQLPLDGIADAIIAATDPGARRRASEEKRNAG